MYVFMKKKEKKILIIEHIMLTIHLVVFPPFFTRETTFMASF